MMMDLMRPWVIVALLVTSAASQSPVSVHDLDNRVVTPLSPAAGEINLVFFIASGCPVSSRYAPEMDRIAADYAGKRVHTFFVFADSSMKVAAARESLESFHPKSRVPAIIDRGLALTTAAGITVTPEVAVYTSAGRVYRGRIDDLYINIGEARRQPTQHDLRNALDASIAGRPVARAETTAVGCFIERKD
jgi:thiol-disulfide isomerase/thioredoxin